MEELILAADAVNVRLEVIHGIPVWEPSPAYEHQIEVDRIRSSIHAKADATCACHHVPDVLFRFPDGSLKRPDIAILCGRPDPSEVRKAITLIPEAVIEIVSPDYERKDDELAPPFYLGCGVKDVLVFDPRSKLVLHHRRDGLERFESPVTISLECGCECVV